MRRITIHADVAGEPYAHDVAVCALSPVAELVPTLVDMVGGEAPDGVAWLLRGVTGAPLDGSMSLVDNGVHDGDVVTLGPSYQPARGLLGVAPVRILADAGGAGRVDDARLIEIGWSWAVLAATITLAWTGLRADPVTAALVAACCAFAASWRGVIVGSPILTTAGALAAGAAGFVAVPAGPAAPNVLLGAAVVFAMSAASARLVPGATGPLTATGSTAVLIAAVASITVAGSLGVAAAGTLLTGGGVALLTLAPRVAALLAGVHSDHLVEPPPDLARRAPAAHAVLTGLVTGASAAVAAGTGLVARAPSAATIAFTTAVALLLLARVRTQTVATRRVALAVGGLASATAALFVTTAAFPGAIGWVAPGVVGAVGIAATTHRRPFARRALGALDHLCAALLVPLACWVLGLYSLARDWVFT